MKAPQNVVTLSIKVVAPAKVGPSKVAELVKQLIGCGIEDAEDTVESREGDVANAKRACALTIEDPVVVQTVTSVPVKHWDRYATPKAINTHALSIEDLRATHGQASMTLSHAHEANETGMCVVMEVNDSPLDGNEAVACAHIHFNENAVALSVFKIGNRLLLRSEGNVTVTPMASNTAGSGNRESMQWLARDSGVVMAELAEGAYTHYDFGTGVQVTDADGWQYSTPGVEMVRKVYVETEAEDDGPAPRWTLNFTVRFNEADDTVAEVYAIDAKGQIWGSMPQAVAAPAQA